MKFKTNINCQNCVSKVTQTLNNIAGEGQWQVDTNVSDKTLTIHQENIDAEALKNKLKRIGFILEES